MRRCFGSACCALALALLTTGACARDPQPNDELRSVQAIFDRLEKFELDFRAAAAAEAGKPDSEKLAFARDVVRQKLYLHFDLQDEIRRVTETLVSRPAPVRASYQAYLREQFDRLKAIQGASKPAEQSLRLEKYNEELKIYGAQVAREPRRQQ